MTIRVDEAPSHQNWATPQAFFDVLDHRFGFDLDVCAEAWSAKCQIFYDEKRDGLSRQWGPDRVCWCNPPYGNVGTWLAKGLTEAMANGCTVVYLLPASTDTAWFHALALRGEIWLIRGRLKFEPPPNYRGNSDSPNFASMLVIYSPEICTQESPTVASKTANTSPVRGVRR